MQPLKNDLILRAARQLPVERTPVWMMRQAGRYLPQYRAIREKYDFLTMCKTPEIATEITLQPVDLMGVDAAIIFSDILVIPEAMGLNLEMVESRGPVFHNPISNLHDIQNLKVIDAISDLGYVMNALSQTKKELNGRVPLIGFSGAPWTLMTYMVEGKGSKDYHKTKSLLYDHPEDAHKLLKILSFAITDYLIAQVEAGADMVQLFDSWASALPPHQYEVFGAPYIEFIVDSLQMLDIPIIVFAKGTNSTLPRLANSGAHVLGIDWSIDLKTAKELTQGKVALQGNLDPAILLASPDVIRIETKKVISDFGSGPGHIFNLGHGITPNINPEHAKVMIETVKEFSKK